jgi:hypothetical protein
VFIVLPHIEDAIEGGEEDAAEAEVGVGIVV